MKFMRIKYQNKNKDETTERNVILFEEVDEPNPAYVCFEVEGLEESEKLQLIDGLRMYWQQHGSAKPEDRQTFDQWRGGSDVPAPKWRRFLRENTEILSEFNLP